METDLSSDTDFAVSREEEIKADSSNSEEGTFVRFKCQSCV